MKVQPFDTWLLENSKPLRKVSELGINRKIPIDRYETELFPRFERLKLKIQALPKSPNLEEFFAILQQDNEFYTRVMADEFAQPDVRELWRDYTGRRTAHMKTYGRK
jgi:hypothetical protein